MTNEVDSLCAHCYKPTGDARLCKRCENKRVIEWVSVDDELPKYDGEYLIFRINKTISVEEFKDKAFTMIIVIKGNELHELKITHWASLERLAPSEDK